MTNKKTKYPILFADSEKFLGEAPSPSIVIHPIDGDWNDFSHRTVFHLTIIEKDNPVFTSKIHLSFLDTEPNPQKVIERILLDELRPAIDASDCPPFFTMLPDMKIYRRFVRTFNDDAKEILLLLNDLVAIKLHSALPPWYKAAMKSNAFNFSFVRNTDSYFAFYNAGSILLGLEHESIGEISLYFHLNFQLPSFRNEHYFHFQFERSDLLPKNIAVLIGSNGTGKSQTLRQLVSSCLSANKNLYVDGNKRFLINRIIAIAAPGETSRTFPSERKDGRIPYKKFSLGRNNKGLGDLIVRLARSSEYIAGQQRWDIFIKSLSTAMDLDEIVLPYDKPWSNSAIQGKFKSVKIKDIIKKHERNFLETCQIIDKSADPVRLIESKFFPLSSGQVTFINFAATLCLHIENGSLVLLDEPETHLHPNLITEMVGLLTTILEMTGSIAIIATHSAYFVREVPRSQVHILKEIEPGFIDIQKPRLKTIGAEVGAISHFIFGDETAGRIINKIKKKIGENPKEAKQKLLSLKDELPSEAIMEISSKLKIKQ